MDIDRARRVTAAAAETANHARNDLLLAVSWFADVDPQEDERDPTEMRAALLIKAEHHANALLRGIVEARKLINP